MVLPRRSVHSPFPVPQNRSGLVRNPIPLHMRAQGRVWVESLLLGRGSSVVFLGEKTTVSTLFGQSPSGEKPRHRWMVGQKKLRRMAWAVTGWRRGCSAGHESTRRRKWAMTTGTWATFATRLLARSSRRTAPEDPSRETEETGRRTGSFLYEPNGFQVP